MSLVGAAKKTAGAVTNTAPESGDATQLQKLMTLNKLTSKILYANILDGIDLEYVLDGGNVKENIIVKEKKDTYSYSFEISLNNLTAELSGSEVLLKDGEETVYTIPAPYMYDAAGEYSDAAEYALTNNGNGKYTLTVTADTEWMNASDRAFPVTIDPPIVAEQELSVTFEHASVDSENYYTNIPDVLYVGHREYEKQYRGFIKISGLDMFTDPAKITEVNLGYVQKSFLYHEQENTSSDMEPLSVVIRPTYTWFPNSINWENQPPAKSNEIVTHSANGTATGSRCYWDITDIVKDELLEYNGAIYLMMQTYNDYNGGEDYLWRGFETDEISGQTPTMTVTFRNDVGLESHWTTTDHSAGFAGSGYVNNRTGELTFVFNTLSTTDSLMPTGFPLVYNTTYANSFMTSANSALPNDGALAGKGFKLGIHETIVPYTIQGTQYYMYTDADGTEHLFTRSSLGTETYKDVDGLGLTLEVDLDNYLYEITDEEGTWYGYTLLTDGSYGGCLVNITTMDGNTLMIDCGGSNLAPSQIRLKPNGQNPFVQMIMEYNTAGLISRVYLPHTNEAYIFYYSTTYSNSSYSRNASGFLRKMVYVKGTDSTTDSEWANYTPTTTTGTITKLAEATYSYDSSGRLTKARDELSNQEIRYTYNSYGKISTVTEYAGTGSSAIQGQKIGFTYYDTSTKVRGSGNDDEYGNSDDLYTNYVFDSRGRTVTVYTTDYTGTVLYGASSAQYEDENEKARNNVKAQIQTNGTYPNYIMDGGFGESFNGSFDYWTKSGNVESGTGRQFDGQSAELTLNNPSGTGSDSDSSSISQNVYLNSGSYNISFDIDSVNCRSAGFTVQVTKVTGGAVVLNKSVPINDVYEAVGTHNYSYSFNVSTAGEYKVVFTLSGWSISQSATSVTLDNVMLSKSNVASEFSYVSYGGFDNDQDNVWSASTYDYGGSFGKVAKVGDTGNTIIEQVIYSSKGYVENTYDYSGVNQTEYALFTLYGWAKKNNVYNFDGNFRMSVELSYYERYGFDNPDYEYKTETFTYDFCKDVDEWQYGAIGFTVEPDNGYLVEIKVILEYSGGGDVAYFDNIVLNKDSDKFSVYDYDDNGYMTYAESGDRRQWSIYDGRNPVLNISSDGSFVYNKYNAKDQLISSLRYSFNGVFYPEFNYNDSVYMCVWGGDIHAETYSTYSYDNYGCNISSRTYTIDEAVNGIYAGGYQVINIKGSSVGAVSSEYNTSLVVSNNNYIGQTATYKTTSGSHIFGAMLTETDSLGKTTRYFYDDDSGYLLAEIKPDGTGLAYTYDDLGNVQTVLPAEYVNGNAVSVGNSANVSYEYDETNRLEKIITDSTEYTFEYNSFGSTTKIFAGSNTLASYTYNSNNGKLSAIDYGNGYGEEYVYDDLDRLKEIYYVVGSTPFIGYRYSYDSNGNLISVEDVRENVVTYMEYDARGRLTGTSTAESGDLVSGSRIGYDEESCIQSYRFSMSIPLTNPGYRVGVSIDTSYSYNSDGSISKSEVSHLNYVNKITPTYDAFGRTTERITEVLIGQTSEFSLKAVYTYKSSGKAQSYLVSEESTGFVMSGTNSFYEMHLYQYTYDDNGNITEIHDEKNNLNIKYWYDELGQLVREDNQTLEKSYTYEYDDAGNILTKKIYNYTTGTLGTPIDTINYTYSGDRLISYDGQSMAYDAIGNPTSYRGKTLTWQNGRELASYDGKYTYSYNADGIRTSKTYNNNGVTYETEYIVDGTKVMRQSWTSEDGTDYVVDYMYDELGRPVSFAISEDGGGYQYYIYETNMFGDVVMIYATNSAEIVSFTYSAYGEITTNVIISQLCDEDFLKAALFRYRGYIYDTESGLYYLQSRYYDPEVGRFISQDDHSIILASPTALTDKNLYAYCDNNPVMRTDSDGDFWQILGGAAIGVVNQLAADLISSAINGEWSFSPASSYIGAAVGGAVGALIPSNAILRNVVTNAVTTSVSMIGENINNMIHGESISYTSEEIFLHASTDAIVVTANSPMSDDNVIGKLVNKYFMPALNDFY